jgi:hypothetical protein
VSPCHQDLLSYPTFTDGCSLNERLSRFGCLSVRTFYHSVDQAISDFKKSEDRNKQVRLV